MSDASERFDLWLDSFFDSYYRHRPINATFIGAHEHDHLLPDCSVDGLESLLHDTQRLQRDLSLLPQGVLRESQAIDCLLASGFLDIQEWELSSPHFQRGNPAYYTGEMVFGVMSLFLREFSPFDIRFENAIARMEAIPVFLEQAQTNVRSAPAEWTQRAIRDCDGAIAFFRSGIQKLPVPHGANQRMRVAADTALQSVMRHRQFLKDEMQHLETSQYGCGPEAFDLLMRRGHMLEISATDIVRYAEDQAAEAEARLVEGAGQFGAQNWQQALGGLAEQHPPIETYYQAYSDVWDRCRETTVSADLLTWPDYPIRYIPRPAWSREAAPYLYFLFYRSPAPFDDVPAVDYLVTPIDDTMPVNEQEALLRAHNDSVIKLNHVVHHGSIGHHVQNWHAFRAQSRIGQMAAVDCASRIAMFCGGTLAEGWSSYATELMGEVGFLTPLERYSQHHARLRMAARAIVDVKLHGNEFNLDDAITYYQERVGMPAGAARDEAVKNSMFPGAAMIYLIGTDMIHDLRRDLTDHDGAPFNQRGFHDTFLSYGSIPVQLISNLMRKDAARAE